MLSTERIALGLVNATGRNIPQRPGNTKHFANPVELAARFKGLADSQAVECCMFHALILAG